MNILIVIADLGLGGAQQVVVNLANEFTRRGNQVWLFDVFPELRKTGVVNRISKKVNLITPDFLIKPKNLFEKTVNRILWKTGFSRNFLKQKRGKEHLKTLKKICKKERIDVVNSHVWWADLFVFENLPELHDNWWITFHGSFGFLIKKPHVSPKFPFLGRKVIENSKGVIYISDAELKQVQEKLSPQFYNFHKILNGVPLTPSRRKKRIDYGFNEKDFLIVCASRAIKEKGWEVLIEAVILLKEKENQVKLIFLGDGPMLQELEEKFKSYSFISFWGFREDVLNIVYISDVFVLPSFSEVFPTVLIESIALGVPIIATNQGETKRIIGSDSCRKSGILLSSQPSVKELVKAIEVMINDPIQLQFFKKNAILQSKNFSIEKMALAYESLFKSKI